MDSDSGGSTDPGFDPEYDAAEKENSQSTSKKGGKGKTKKSKKSKKPKKSNEKVLEAKKRKYELKTKRKSDKPEAAIVTVEACLAQANIGLGILCSGPCHTHDPVTCLVVVLWLPSMTGHGR